jgi:hypothetical protein
MQQTWYMMDWREVTSGGDIYSAPTAALYVMSYAQFGPARVSCDWGAGWQATAAPPSASPYYVGGTCVNCPVPFSGVGQFGELHALWAGYRGGGTGLGTFYHGDAHLIDDPLSMYYLDHPPAVKVCDSQGSAQLVLESDGALSAFVRPAGNNVLEWWRSRSWGRTWEVVDVGFAY